MSQEVQDRIPAEYQSSAPLVLGIVGFALSLPNIICNVMCTIIAGSAEVNAAMIWYLVPVILAVACLMGSCQIMRAPVKKAKTVSILVIIYACIYLVLCIVHFSILGLIGGILYVIAGAVGLGAASKVR